MFPGESEEVEPLFDDEADEQGKRVEPRVVTRQERDTAVRTWLLVSAESVEKAQTDWEQTGIALLECGARFGAVRMKASLVYAAAGSDEPDQVREFLTAVLFGGPVFMDRRKALYYALVPASTACREEWCDRRYTPDAESIGRSCYLGVPRPGLDEPRSRYSSYWCVPMYGPGDLCDPEAVSQLVIHGRRLLATQEALNER